MHTPWAAWLLKPGVALLCAAQSKPGLPGRAQLWEGGVVTVTHVPIAYLISIAETRFIHLGSRMEFVAPELTVLGVINAQAKVVGI